MSKKKLDKEKLEYRQIDLTPTQTQKEGCFVSGQAIVFNSPTVLYTDRFGQEYREIIAPGALEGCDLSDVPLKYNHDQEKAKILARVRNKTLSLDLRETGLYFDAELRTNLGKDVYSAIEAGDIGKCSFAFICDDEEYDEATCTRTIKHISYLGDISIVDSPAYDQTFVEVRALDFFKEQEERKVKAFEAEERQRLFLLTMIDY